MTTSDFTTITGADMTVYFGFREIYLSGDNTGNPVEKANRYVWFDVGTVTQIRYAAQKPAAPKYIMNTLNPVGIGQGISMTQGDMIFKNFNEDSVNYILNKIKSEVAEHYGMTAPVVSNTEEGYAAVLEGDRITEALEESQVEGFWSEPIIHWDELPPFNIMIMSKSNDYDLNGNLSKIMIKNVKVTDVGSSESIDSTEVNDIVKFIATSGIESWREIAPGDTVGGVANV